jgi:hypothetical protein
MSGYDKVCLVRSVIMAVFESQHCLSSIDDSDY